MNPRGAGGRRLVVAAVVVGVLAVLAAGCSAGRPASAPGKSGLPGAGPAATVSHAAGTKALAARYLAIAKPANRRLDADVDAVADHVPGNLAAAESALRAEAATERRFDRLLGGIPFPARIAAIAGALVLANQRRADLVSRQARASSITRLLSFAGRHTAADAAVEAQVRRIRRALGLPPPATS